MVTKKKKTPTKNAPAPQAEVRGYGNIRPCTCDHEYQDRLYGKGMRLHTTCKTGSPGGAAYRCTVCGTRKG